MPTPFPKLLTKLCNPFHAEILTNLTGLDELESGVPDAQLHRNTGFGPEEVASTKKRGIWRVFKPTRSLASVRTADTDFKRNTDVSFNRLPLELLLDIFIHTCHSDYDKYLWDKERLKKTTPFTLGAVCVYWRQVVWASSSLWSHIYLTLSTKRYTRQVKLLKFWLERSGDAPILLNLVLANEEDWDGKRIPNALIDILLGYASRWHTISWVLPEAWYPRLNGIRDRLNNLHSICTQPTYKDADLSPSLRERLIFLDIAPKLDRVHLNGYYLTDVPLQWVNLTHLTLQQVYIDECYYAFQRSPNLYRCKISKLLVNDVARTVEHPSTPIALDQMKRFILHASAWNDVVALLKHVSIHTLDMIDLSGSSGDPPFDTISNSILGTLGGLGLKPKRATIGGEFSTLSKLTLGSICLRPLLESEDRIDEELKRLLIQLPALETVDLEIKSNSHSGRRLDFCIWWFVSFLKAHPIDGMQDNITLDPALMAPEMATNIEHSLLELRSEDTETLPPARSPEEVIFHLPHLRHFKFSILSVIAHYDLKHPCPEGCRIPHMMQTLVELLKQRCGKASPYRRKLVRGASIDTMGDLPLKEKLEEFSLKLRLPSSWSANVGMSKSILDNFEQLKQEDIRFKFDIGSTAWNMEF